MLRWGLALVAIAIALPAHAGESDLPIRGVTVDLSDPAARPSASPAHVERPPLGAGPRHFRVIPGSPKPSPSPSVR